jgi:hypothetical protein
MGFSSPGKITRFALLSRISLLKELFDFYHFHELSGWNQTSSGIQIRISNPEKVRQACS